MTIKETDELIRDYVKSGSETAFKELVDRYINLVYSAALRRSGSDSNQIEDIVQTVFADFARKAAQLPKGVLLGGWLHQHTCFVASNMLRADLRRQTREKEAMKEFSTVHAPDIGLVFRMENFIMSSRIILSEAKNPIFLKLKLQDTFPLFRESLMPLKERHDWMPFSNGRRRSD
jgi:DNA-directed RNA polymerase specialized sigma24 family protein